MPPVLPPMRMTGFHFSGDFSGRCMRMDGEGMNAEEAGVSMGRCCPCCRPLWPRLGQRLGLGQQVSIFRTVHSSSSFHRTLPDSCRVSSPLLRLFLTHQDARNGSEQSLYLLTDLPTRGSWRSTLPVIFLVQSWRKRHAARARLCLSARFFQKFLGCSCSSLQNLSSPTG